MGSELVLILVVIAGFSFDFTNGFHDTANAMATSIATGALKPKVAVIISACLNFAGAFISISVAPRSRKGSSVRQYSSAATGSSSCWRR
jgi:inorganic phosphate transporter, PiT family